MFNHSCHLRNWMQAFPLSFCHEFAFWNQEIHFVCFLFSVGFVRCVGSSITAVDVYLVCAYKHVPARPLWCAHTLKHVFPMARTVSQADIWHHALNKEEVFHCVCYSVCVCLWEGRRKMVVIMTYGLDSSFLLGIEDRNDYTEECSWGVCRKEWADDRRRREFKQNKEKNLHQPPAKAKNHREKRCQKTRRPEVLCVYAFHSVSQSLLHRLYLWHSSQFLNDSLPSEVLWTWLCWRWLRINRKSCLIIPTTTVANSF